MKRQSTAEDAGINLTPMIDVVFLLVIFFMVGDRMTRPEPSVDVQVAPPGSATASLRPPDAKIVAVDAAGNVTLDGTTMSLAELQATLSRMAAAYPEIQVTVRGDGDTVHRRFVETLQTVGRAGVTKIDIPTGTRRR